MATKRQREEEIEEEHKKQKIAYSVQEALATTARKIASTGKGILAADESTGTIQKRFEAIKLENTVTNRQAYRELLFTAPNLNKYISGVILYEETLFQNSSSGVSFPQLLASQDIVVGIKVDLGLKNLPGTNGEMACQGLTDLDVRCKKYYEAGARFAKWRAVFQLDLKNGKPSELAIETQAHDLARYAGICQANSIVPIVEPELLMDGDHDIETCAKVSEHIWATVVHHLHEKKIFLEGCLLKPNMVMSGQDSKTKATKEEVAKYTLRTLLRTIPPSLSGVMFLSGGQTEEEASLNLNEINKLAKARSAPWVLSFSYGRALQASTIKTWNGEAQNVAKSQEVFLTRCKANSDAQLGIYVGSGVQNESLFEPDYKY